MSKAFQRGIGVSTNLIEPYAWLQLAAEFATVPILQRGQLNQMALIMDSGSLQQAQALAEQFKAGALRCPELRIVPESDSRLKLTGISFGAKSSLASINRHTLSEGESAKIKVGQRPLLI